MAIRKPIVFCLLPNLEVGGAETQLLKIIPYLNDKVEVRLLAQKKGSLVEVAQSLGVYKSRFSRTKVGFLASVFSQLLFARFLSRRPVVVEAYLPSMIAVAATLKALLIGNLNVIANRRSHLFYRGRSKYRDIVDVWSSSRVDFTICNTPSIKVELVDRGELSTSRVSVIPNALAVGGALSKDSNRNSETRLVVVSNHHHYKRVNDILLAVKELQSHNLFPKVFLFGVGEETSNLMETSNSLNLSNVFFEGVKTNPWSDFGSSDIFIHASETEGFSNAILEAMGNSLACVLSDIEANRFVAENCAKYFKVGDVIGLSEILIHLLESPEDRAKLVSCSLERVKQEFSVEKLVDKRIKVYERLISLRN